MGWLKTVAKWLVMGFRFAEGFAPIVQGVYQQSGPVIQKVESEITSLMGIILTAEQFGQMTGLPGAEKARIAGPLIQQLISQSEFMLGKSIGDPVANAKAAQVIAGGVADYLNSLAAPAAPPVVPTV